MSGLHPADRQARSSRRRLRRKQRKVRGISRIFETIAALMPTMVMLTHLSLKAAEVKPEKKETPPVIATASDSSTKSPEGPITAVPEPSTAGILGVGAALLLMRKHNRNGATAKTGHP